MVVPAGHPEKPQGEEGFKMLERMNGGHHEELALWGLSHLPLQEDAHVLDIGCGGGANIARLLNCTPQGFVAGVDYSPVSVRASRDFNAQAIANGRCVVREGNASALPFEDAAFNAATAFETTYYWDLPTAFLQVRRVLVPGGRFLICNEDDGQSPEGRQIAEQIPGMTMYTADQLVATLEQAGFSVEETEAIPERGHLAIVARAPGA